MRILRSLLPSRAPCRRRTAKAIEAFHEEHDRWEREVERTAQVRGFGGGLDDLGVGLSGGKTQG